MGREIIIQAKINGEVKYENYVCGRDSATEYIANLVNDYCNSHNLDTCEISYVVSHNNTYQCIESYYEDTKQLTIIKRHLEEYAQQDEKEIANAKEYLNDLKVARRNTTTAEEFDKFTSRIEDATQWVEDNDYSRARNLINIIELALKIINKFKSPIQVGVITIIWSE